MEQKLVCDTVRDLLPVYIDKMTSEVSNQSIEEHLNECSQCKLVLEQMKEPVQVDAVPEIKEFKKYLRKSKMSLFYWIMGIGALLAVITCFIVNLAVEKRLSWFYIVTAGIVTAYLPVYAGIHAKKHGFIKAAALLNLCSILLVGVIQIVLYYMMGIGELWFWNKGLPISLLWSCIVWIGIASKQLLHVNPVIALSVIALLAVGGNYLTNRICGYYDGWQDYMADFISNGFGNAVAGVVLLVIGICIEMKRKGSKREV